LTIPEFLAVFKGLCTPASYRSTHQELKEISDAIAKSVCPVPKAPSATQANNSDRAPNMIIGMKRGQSTNSCHPQRIPKPKVNIVVRQTVQVPSTSLTPGTRSQSDEKATASPGTLPEIKSAVQATVAAKYKREARGRGVSKKNVLICLQTKKSKSKCKGDCCNPNHYTGAGGHKHCKVTRKRKALCDCKNCGGAFLCSHGRQKHKCSECGGNSMCKHGDQKSRCKKCYQETGVLHSSMCLHSGVIFEKWRCKICNPDE